MQNFVGHQITSWCQKPGADACGSGRVTSRSHPRRRLGAVLLGHAGVVLAEAVAEELLQAYLLLLHESLALLLAAEVEVQHAAQSRGGRDLDGAPSLSQAFAVIDLASIGELREATLLPSGDRAEDKHDILGRHGDGVFQDVLEQRPSVV